MKIPQKPPSWQKQFTTLSGEEVDELFQQKVEDEKYLHWDDLRYRKPPKGMSLEHWWCALKLQRIAAREFIPLADPKGIPFSYSMTNSISSAVHKIDLGAGGALCMPEQVTNEQTRDYYYVSSLMNEAITSSQLEGAAVTREDAKEMIRSKRRPRDRGEKMILNNYRTMIQLEEWKSEPLSQDLVFRIHRLITEDTLDDETAAGRFRTAEENIYIHDGINDEVLYTPPPADQLTSRMEKLCLFANGESDTKTFLHPVLRAIILHFWLAYDHPFKDGNGRTARALFYWYLLRTNYWLFQFISISEILVRAPVKYARSYLLTETDDNDLNYFIHYQLEVIERAIQSLHSYIERKSAELTKVSELLKGVDCINYRQEALIEKALREPGARFTIQGHQSSFRLAYATARSDLLGLADLNLFHKLKRGKGYVFMPNSELQSQIAALGKT